MPGFFDVFFRPAEPEPVPEPPKPKKAKKAKKVKKTKKTERGESPFMGMIKGMQTRIEQLEARITEPEPEPEPEPVVEAEEPEDDEPVE